MENTILGGIMDKYFELRYWIDILKYVVLALIILAMGLCVLYFKITEYLKKRFRKKDKE